MIATGRIKTILCGLQNRRSFPVVFFKYAKGGSRLHTNTMPAYKMARACLHFAIPSSILYLVQYLKTWQLLKYKYVGMSIQKAILTNYKNLPFLLGSGGGHL